MTEEDTFYNSHTETESPLCQNQEFPPTISENNILKPQISSDEKSQKTQNPFSLVKNFITSKFSIIHLLIAIIIIILITIIIYINKNSNIKKNLYETEIKNKVLFSENKKLQTEQGKLFKELQLLRKSNENLLIKTKNKKRSIVFKEDSEDESSEESSSEEYIDKETELENKEKKIVEFNNRKKNISAT